MPASSRIDGLALGTISAGALFAYAGVKGYSVPHALQALIRGQAPSTGGVANPITAPPAAGGVAGAAAATGALAGAGIVSGGSAQAILQKTAAQFGWGTGGQWQSLQALELAEGGFNTHATNPTSGAFGLAQALGHGGAGTACPSSGENNYGGYGLSPAQAQAANCGDAGAQALWMCNYIRATYGDPNTAWGGYRARGSWY